MDYLYLAIIALLVIINIEQRIKHDGVLKIDISNPNNEVYRFEVNEIDKLKNKKRITLKVDTSFVASQENQTM